MISQLTGEISCKLNRSMIGYTNLSSTNKMFVKDIHGEILLQWSPALRTPAFTRTVSFVPTKSSHIFSKITPLIRTPVNTDNGHFSVSRVTNSHILSTSLYGHWLSAHCLFSLSQRLYNHSSKQLMLQIPPKMVVVVAGGH